ncbi:MAG: cytochrome c biogenesis protein ResB [Chloroflexi bacterium]|nr:cytochrome c biogenesis protein ResB [Chloroflexota bacterium]
MAIEKQTTALFPRAVPARRWRRLIAARDSFWKPFSSVKLALILILMLAALTLVGTFVGQVPNYIQVPSAEYAAWLAQAQVRFGPVTPVLDRLQLFYVFDSILFIGTGFLLLLNILVCALNRWPGIWNSIAHNRVRMSQGFYTYAPMKLTAAQPPAQAAETLRRVLKKSRYRVVVSEEAGQYYLFCDRNRLAPLGTYLSHLGLILLVLAYISGQVMGWRHSEFIITEGETQEVGFGTGLSMTLEQFADEWWLSGPPKDYRSDVVIYDNGLEVKQGTIRVNHPLSYQGIRFFQSFYGTSAMMEVQDRDGTVLLQAGVPLAWEWKDRRVGSVSIPEKDLVLWVVLPQAGAVDPLIKPGEVRLEVAREGSTTPIGIVNLSQGQPQEVAGLTYTFLRERPFTGLQVARDPALPLVWVAFTLMTVGMAMVFYFPHRRLWSAVGPRTEGGSALSFRGIVGKDNDFRQEMERLAEKAQQALSKA